MKRQEFRFASMRILRCSGRNRFQPGKKMHETEGNIQTIHSCLHPQGLRIRGGSIHPQENVVQHAVFLHHSTYASCGEYVTS
jgi:hypothetical protein